MEKVIIGIISASIATLISGIFAFINLHLTRRSEERRQVRDLAVHIALENWKSSEQTAKEIGVGNEKFDVYMIHALNLAAALNGKLKTEKQIRSHMLKTAELVNATSKAIEDLNEE